MRRVQRILGSLVCSTLYYISIFLYNLVYRKYHSVRGLKILNDEIELKILTGLRLSKSGKKL